MATKFKGITVQIGGDTTGLDKALSGVNKEAREIQQELREVNKELKIDPGNTELIVRKQKLLALAVENTAEKYKALEEVQEQVTQQAKDGKISDFQLIKFQNEIDKTRNKLLNLKEAPHGMDKITSGADKASAEVKDLNNDLKKTGDELKNVGDKADGGLGKADKSALSTALSIGKIGIAIKVVKEALEAAQKAYKALISANAEREQYVTSFTVMLGDAEKARKLIDDITKMAADTPFEIGDLNKAGQMLMNYGVSADNVIEKMTQLGDLSAGNAQKLDRISLAYGQMLAKGKVTGEELRQMTEAGVPMLQALADSMNVSTAELQKMISAGKVGIPELDKAIEKLTTDGGKFAGMMEAQAKTLEGIMSNLSDRGKQFTRKMGVQVFEETKAFLTSLKEQIEQMDADGKLDGLSGSIDRLLGSIANGITMLGEAGIGTLEDFVTGLEAITNIIGFIPNQIKIICDTYPEAKEFFVGIGEAVMYAANPLAILGKLINDFNKLVEADLTPENEFKKHMSQLTMDMEAYKQQIEAYNQAIADGDEEAAKSFEQGVKDHEEYIRQSASAMVAAQELMDQTDEAAIQASKDAAVLLEQMTELGIAAEESMEETTTALRRYGESVVDGMEHKAKRTQTAVSETISDSFKKSLDNMDKNLALGYISEEQYYKQLERLLQLHNAKEKSEYTQYYASIRKYREDQNKKIADEQKKANEKLVAEQEKAAKASADSWKKEFDVVIASGKSATEAVIRQQEQLESKLKGTVKLYRVDENGEVVVNSLEEQTEAIRKYKQVIDELNYQGVSDRFMAQFMEYDMLEAAAFGEALLSDTELLKEYIAEWEAQQDEIIAVSKDVYSNEADAVQAEFTDKITDKLAEMPDIARTLGEETAREYLDGIKAGMAELDGLFNSAAVVGSSPAVRTRAKTRTYEEQEAVLQSTANKGNSVIPSGLGGLQKIIINIGDERIAEFTIDKINEAAERGEVVLNI